MGRRPASDKSVKVAVGNTLYDVATSTLAALPDARRFLTALLDRGVIAPTALEYVRLAAKARREGRLQTPEVIVSRATSTAVNAYWKWVNESYEVRIRPILSVLRADVIRKGLKRIRVSSLVPPFEGKVVPVEPHPLSQDPTPRSVPCAGWTLHVPRHDDTPAHRDPCMECVPLELDAKQLQVVAQAFYDAWGNVELASMPPECLLFGQPPIGSPLFDGLRAPPGRIVALIGETPLAHALEQLHASATPHLRAFLDRLAERIPDVVVIDSRTAPDGLPAALRAAADALEPRGERAPGGGTNGETQITALPDELPV